MLRPFIVVGVGGSGGKTVRALRASLASKLETIGWNGPMPTGWQFLHIDSPTAQDGLEFPAPLMSQEEYLSLVPSGATYSTVHAAATGKVASAHVQDIKRSLPSPSEVSVPISMGAGAFRAVGRTISAAGLGDMKDRFKVMVADAQSPEAKAELSDLAIKLQISMNQEVAADPITIVVSSMAGGSGAGMFLDVAEALKGAIGTANWNDQVISMLFTPDVFAEFGDGVKKMVPNTLGALAELTSGFFRNSPTPATNALYSKFGMNANPSAAYSLGANYNFVIGRKNTGGVDFGSQTGMYLATGQAISAWMLDPNVQDKLSAYQFTNMLSTSSQQEDATGLRRPKLDAQPMFSMGFARVTLGIDKFSDYSAERLAKQALETVIRQHLQDDPDQREKKESEWIEYHADNYFGTFITESGLNEKTETANQVVDAIHPDLTELKARLVSDVLQASSSGMPKGGNSFESWVSRITTSYDNYLGTYLDELEDLSRANVRKWVDQMPEKIMSLVRKTIAQVGMPVTNELLKRVIADAKFAVTELEEERGVHISHSSMVTNEVSSALGPASTMSAIPSNHPAVDAAMQAVDTSFHWRAVAEIKKISGEILQDFLDNFMDPLQSDLSKSFGALKMATDEMALPDNRKNPYETWPDFSKTSVSGRFDPAPNESMLIDPKSFPKEFDELIEDTINDKGVNSKKAVIAQILGGSEHLSNIDEIKDDMQWRVFGYRKDQFWVPQNRHYQIKPNSPQSARFEFQTDHMKFLDYSKKWMRIPGRAFNAYLDQTLVSFIEANGDPSLKTKRGTEFANAVKTVIRSASPLISINKALEKAVHGTVPLSATCTGIPVDMDDNDPLYPGIKDAILANGYNLDNPSQERKWFSGAADGAKKTTVEVFTVLDTPVNPVVIESLMEPISSQWRKVSGEYSSRAPFMNWRRARELDEAIPASPDQWRKMLRGWFVGRVLDLFQNETSHPDYDQKGPVVRIWDGPGNGWAAYPHPLYSANIARNVDDYPAIVLDSLLIALTDCFIEQSLAPLRPYQRLMELGGGENNHWQTLEDWILRGVVDSGGPVPRAERAGTREGSVDERRNAASEYMSKLQASFEKKITELDPHSDPRYYPISWELRDDIVSAMEDVKKQISSIEDIGDL